MMREKPVLIGELIQKDKFAPPLKMVITKTWWEKFWEAVRIAVVSVSLIGIGWMLNELIRGI